MGAPALSGDRKQNFDEVEEGLTQVIETARSEPNARERQVLNYHKKHKSKWPSCEEIQQKYPDW